MKPSRSFYLGVLALISLAMATSSCQKMTPIFPNPKATEKKSITQLISQAPDLRFLEAAVIRAGLSETLDKAGTYTVFAPVDDAFRAAGFQSVEEIKKADPEWLKGILLYHALGAEVSAAAVQGASAKAVTTLSGQDFYVTGKNGNVWVNNAKVIVRDVKASNGIIHVIDAVLIPPTKDLVALAQSNPDLSILVQAVVQAGATGLLQSAGPFTVFAPTNQAFQNLLVKLGANGLGDIDNAVLLDVLKYHVLSGRYFSYMLAEGLVLPTAQGGSVTISLMGGASVKAMSNTTASHILAVDKIATNGVVHVIDQVLLP